MIRRDFNKVWRRRVSQAVDDFARAMERRSKQPLRPGRIELPE